MWRFFLGILSGLGSAVHFSASPLYRSPHRNSAEALRGDWLRIGKDISSTMNKDEEDNRDERE
jgi:hypothetical protein